MKLTSHQEYTAASRPAHEQPTTPPDSFDSASRLDRYSYSLSESSRIPRSYSYGGETMANTHARGLPPPAALALSQQQPPPPMPQAPHPQPVNHPHHGQPAPPMPPPAHSHHQRDSWGSSSLPPPPQSAQHSPHWQGGDESMRTWLVAKTEEEKTKQEEEKTRQESLRLEQRKIEMDILRASLGGGIPPPMVPLVFAGMGGGVLPQAAIDWAQSLLPPQQGHPPQLLPAQRAASPEPLREGVQPGQYHASQSVVSSGPQPQPAGYPSYPDAQGRPRGQTVSGAITHSASSGTVASGSSSHGASGTYQPQRSVLQAPSNESNSSIYFHHWQPPGSLTGGSSSNRPATPSGESQKKRKVAGDVYQHSRASSTHRSRSPPNLSQQEYANNPPNNPPSSQQGNRRGHKRHKSDVTWYQAPRHGFSASGDSTHRPGTPVQDNSSVSSRDRDVQDDRKQPPSYRLSREREEEPRSAIEPRGGMPSRIIEAPFDHRRRREPSVEMARRRIPEER